MITKSKKPVIVNVQESRIIPANVKKSLPATVTLPNPTVRMQSVMVDYMFRHNERAAFLGRKIAELMGLNKSDRDIVEYAILLHDAGKGFVEPYIVHKPGKLTQREYERMKSHTAYGRGFVEHLLKGNPLAQIIAETAYYHHEIFGKGGGYYGVDAHNFGLHTKIAQVVEVADAILARRTYKKSKGLGNLADEIRKGIKTGQFDPEIAEVFLKAMEQEKLGFGTGLLDYKKVARETEKDMKSFYTEFRKETMTNYRRATILADGGNAAEYMNRRRDGPDHRPFSHSYGKPPAPQKRK
ncbi:MAG: HD domain-containing protein [archaeon]|nr:HD domain-containing protein [archaeon]